MTTESERRFIFDLFTELRRCYRAAEQASRASAPSMGFGVYDEDEHVKAEREHAASVAAHRATMSTCEAIWAFTKTRYSNWDINLSLQDAEGRIGDLPYTD